MTGQALAEYIETYVAQFSPNLPLQLRRSVAADAVAFIRHKVSVHESLAFNHKQPGVVDIPGPVNSPYRD